MQSVSRTSAVAQADQPTKALADGIVNQVFDSLRWTNVKDGTIQEVSCLDTWRHRTLQDIESDLAYLEITRTEILSALSRYLATPSLQTRELDWLFLNVLTYAEYVATIIEIRKKLLGINGFIKSIHPPKAEHLPNIDEFASHTWKSAIAVVLTVLSAFIHPLFALAVGSWVAYSYIRKAKMVKEVNSTLASMLRTYASFNTVDMSWSHISKELEESRQNGAVWDASLFRLAESRQNAA